MNGKCQHGVPFERACESCDAPDLRRQLADTQQKLTDAQENYRLMADSRQDALRERDGARAEVERMKADDAMIRLIKEDWNAVVALVEPYPGDFTPTKLEGIIAKLTRVGEILCAGGEDVEERARKVMLKVDALRKDWMEVNSELLSIRQATQSVPGDDLLAKVEGLVKVWEAGRLWILSDCASQCDCHFCLILAKMIRGVASPKPAAPTKALGATSAASIVKELREAGGKGWDSMEISASSGAGVATGEGADKPLTLAMLREANQTRAKKWHNGTDASLEFRAVELGEEVGEVQGAVKKLARLRNGWKGGKDMSENLAEELGDVVICADLLAMTAGIDLGKAVAAKFNATSEKHGFEERLPAPPSGADAAQVPTLNRCKCGGEAHYTVNNFMAQVECSNGDATEQFPSHELAAAAWNLANPTPLDAREAPAGDKGETK